MPKFKKQTLRALVVAVVVIAALLASQDGVQHNPLDFLSAHWREIVFAYFIVTLLCWAIDAAFEGYFQEYKLNRGQKVKLGIMLITATTLTTLAFYYDWKYDHLPGRNNGPFVVNFVKEWPIWVIYISVISFFGILFYLAVKLLVGELVRLYKFIRNRFIEV